MTTRLRSSAQLSIKYEDSHFIMWKAQTTYPPTWPFSHIWIYYLSFQLVSQFWGCAAGFLSPLRTRKKKHVQHSIYAIYIRLNVWNLIFFFFQRNVACVFRLRFVGFAWSFVIRPPFMFFSWRDGLRVCCQKERPPTHLRKGKLQVRNARWLRVYCWFGNY